MTLFLYIFISGQADHVIVLKEVYLTKFLVEAKAIKQYHNELENCDLDWTKAHKSMMKLKKPTIRRTYKENGTFDWGPKQKSSFQGIKNAIINNVVTGADSNLKFHFSVNISQINIRGILFLIKGVKPGIEVSTKLAENE